MKRTLIPKLLAALTSLLAGILLPPPFSLPLIALILAGTLLYILLPVFHPQSNFYIPTMSFKEGSRDRVSLTFDDGPDPRFTPAILDLLDTVGIKAAFFVVGRAAERHPELIRDIVARGHIIGNHSLRHDLGFHFGRTKSLQRDFDEFDRIMDGIIGKRCAFFRAPQGFRNPVLADVLRARRLICVAWNARGFDALRRNEDSIFRSILKGLKPGSIILLHDGGGETSDRTATLKVLPRLLREMGQRGLLHERLDSFLGFEAYQKERG